MVGGEEFLLMVFEKLFVVLLLVAAILDGSRSVLVSLYVAHT